MAIPRLDIKGLKGVGDVELRFDADARVVVLFGENGVGKTKCLEALFQFLLLADKKLSDNLFHLNGDITSFFQEIELKSSIGSLLMVGASDGIHNLMASNISDGKYMVKPNQWLPLVYLGANQRASLPKELSQASQQDSFEALIEPNQPLRLFKRICQTLQEGGLASMGMHEDVRAWVIVRARAMNAYQKENYQYGQAINTLLRLLHEISEKRIDPEYLKINKKDQVFIRLDGEERELGELSSGFISLVKIIQAIVAGYGAWTDEDALDKVKGVVFIDEIESHLHVKWQVKIVGMLKKLFPNTTFYIATHSPLVLTQLDDNEAYKLVRHEDGVVRSHQMKGHNKRVFDDALEENLGVDLSALKRERMGTDSQKEAKKILRDLIAKTRQEIAVHEEVVN